MEYVDDQCYNGTMMPANVINKRHLEELIADSVEPKNKANFEMALEEAFSLLLRVSVMGTVRLLFLNFCLLMTQV